MRHHLSCGKQDLYKRDELITCPLSDIPFLGKGAGPSKVGLELRTGYVVLKEKLFAVIFAEPKNTLCVCF